MNQKTVDNSDELVNGFRVMLDTDEPVMGRRDQVLVGLHQMKK